MPSIALIITIVVFLLIILFRMTHKLLADTFLFALFMFAFIITDRGFSSYYLLALLIAIVIDLALPQFDIRPQKSANIFGGKFAGVSLVFVSIVIGIAIFLVIAVISTRVEGNIVGVPDLAVSPLDKISYSFKPALESALGIIENRIFFVFLEVLVAFGLAIPILGFIFSFIPFLVPMSIISLLFAVFHVVAYNVAIGIMIWAMLAFILFAVPYIITRDTLIADTAHYLNNAVVSFSRTLQVVV